jgi:hypothetical protein
MLDRDGESSGDVRPKEPHEEFLALCALATAGSLSDGEENRLREHLAICGDCRAAVKQFESVIDHGLPALAAELAGDTTEKDSAFSLGSAEAAFFKRLSREGEKSRAQFADAEPWLSPLVVRRSRDFRRRFDRYYFWLPMAGSVVLCVALAVLAYRMGTYHGVEVGRLEPRDAPPGPASSAPAFAIASHDRDAANAELAQRNQAIVELKHEIVQEMNENAKLRAAELEKQGALQASEEEKRSWAEERDRNARQAVAGQEALQASQAKLETLERERAQDVIRVASLEANVAELSRSLKEQERSAGEEAELLAKDRDIRELMGARDLYVAEVHDIARTGETEKAFGRVFYTKGKSLIFYAYDLNDPPGLKDASTFEAWGRRGPDWTQACKLGMFYEDNAAKKRWVLKYNDKKTLDQIDAVFVTVEPHGGSDKPTGKPLLFAYLKVTANHP